MRSFANSQVPKFMHKIPLQTFRNFSRSTDPSDASLLRENNLQALGFHPPASTAEGGFYPVRVCPLQSRGFWRLTNPAVCQAPRTLRGSCCRTDARLPRAPGSFHMPRARINIRANVRCGPRMIFFAQNFRVPKVQISGLQIFAVRTAAEDACEAFNGA